MSKYLRLPESFYVIALSAQIFRNSTNKTPQNKITENIIHTQYLSRFVVIF